MRPSPPAASPATSAVGGEALPGLPVSLTRPAGQGRPHVSANCIRCMISCGCDSPSGSPGTRSGLPTAHSQIDDQEEGKP